MCHLVALAACAPSIGRECETSDGMAGTFTNMRKVVEAANFPWAKTEVKFASAWSVWTEVNVGQLRILSDQDFHACISCLIATTCERANAHAAQLPIPETRRENYKYVTLASYLGHVWPTNVEKIVAKCSLLKAAGNGTACARHYDELWGVEL